MSYRSMQPAVHKPGGGGILEWFEAYADALDSGYFRVVSSCNGPHEMPFGGLRTYFYITTWQCLFSSKHRGTSICTKEVNLPSVLFFARFLQ